MDSKRAQELYLKYRTAMAYISVEKPNGDHAIGTAFHLGEGVFVTARHVVDGNQVLEVGMTEPVRVPIGDVFPEAGPEYVRTIEEWIGEQPTWPQWPGSLAIEAGPHFHPDAAIDIAVFRTDKVHSECAHVLLGSHLDDWLHRTNWVLSEAIVLGYPPIPFTTEPYLVVTRAEVNALINPRGRRHPYFILSATPRGGFSGGLALSGADFALGVVVESLVTNDAPAELGFLCVLTVEPIYECLAKHRLIPKCQKEGWDDFWNTETVDFVKQQDAHSWLAVASIGVHDDGTNPYVIVTSRDTSLLGAAVKAAAQAAEGASINQTDQPHQVIILPPGGQAEALPALQSAAAAVFVAAGLDCHNRKAVGT